MEIIMDWFINWWEGLGILGQIFATAAIPATVVMVLQTLLLLFGIGMNAGDHGEGFDGADHADVDHDGCDLDHDHGFDHHFDGLRLFTVRGIVAMLAVGGWIGVAACDAGAAPFVSGLCAILSGLAALFVAAYIIKISLKLQDDGNFNMKNAIAHTATVYIPIPANRVGSGKVTMNLQERFVELDALTDHNERIPTGAMVQVVSVTDKNEVIVRPMK